MDDNMNNGNMQNDEDSFGSSEYYKKLYDDMPEDVAEMLIGTHPLMKKEVSEALTHNIKIKSAKEKNRKAVSETPELDEEISSVEEEQTEEPLEEIPQGIVPSKDPVQNEEIHQQTPAQEKNTDEYLGDITSYTRGLVSSPAGKKQKKDKHEKQNKHDKHEKSDKHEKYEKVTPRESIENDDKSENDLTAEMIAKMLGGGDVTPVDDADYDGFEMEEEPVKASRSDVHENKEGKRNKKKRRNIDEKDLEISNIEKQANLNELFREDDDYYDEKHSGFSLARIAVIVVAIVIFAFLVYKVASLSGQVSKLNEQITTYKTMEQEYDQMKLDNLSLTEQVESLTKQTNGGTSSGDDTTNPDDSSTEPASTNNNSSNSTTTTSSTTYTVQAGDTFWGIASKMYGNGSYYEKILSANSLSENDKLREGMELKIPAL